MTAVLRKSPVESWEEHVEAWHHLGREVDGAAWGRAAIAASLKGRYGEDAVGKFAAEVGFSPAAIYGFARTFDAFPELSTRVETLTFSHHRLAAELTASAQEAKAALEMAAREGWSANALRAFLRPPPPAPSLPACETDGEACGPATRNDKAFHVVSLVESLTQSMTLFDAVKAYEIDPLFERRTKKSMAEFSAKLRTVIEWMQALETTVNRRKQ